MNEAEQKASITDVTTDLVHGQDRPQPTMPETLSSTVVQREDVQERLCIKTEELARWKRQAEEQWRDEVEEREDFDRIATELLAYIDRREHQEDEFRAMGTDLRVVEQLRAEVEEREAFDCLAQEMLMHVERARGIGGAQELAIPRMLGRQNAQTFAAGQDRSDDLQRQATQAELTRLRKTINLARAAAIVLYRHGPLALMRRATGWLKGIAISNRT